ncbi:CAMK protein kinase [Phytophthora nicotianae CJ01A1]|uniref:CAMK protein kinase n=6 Tax=Phytophthora nicotianae TaxID=4792 RepID=W2R9L3_PHYN3|nr:CAMK protein kinase [Phytophthora nicotianae INRA-310]ETI45482.1 CAMK protein kinase [Phytophthora nicotianae P1569]ETK85427.1 CAMK protein kinase [Phytophthora nicotianae]ETO74120.1 CAMK protein kinase [Phytophthora nicotianae P1976]ETP15286.1 CAMK protein kinase [Phytophthora nicotianae CJ01A1]ETP43342.1 CAMK protein kinase [Phytophthora nicotianae P10297]
MPQTSLHLKGFLALRRRGKLARLARSQSFEGHRTASLTGSRQRFSSVPRRFQRVTVNSSSCNNGESNSGKAWREMAALGAAMSGLVLASASSDQESDAAMESQNTQKIKRGGNIHDDYEILDEIVGEGGYCVVQKGIDRRTGELVAVKMLSKSETSAREFWSEVDVLRVAGLHPNILQLRGTYETDCCWFIVQELAQDGELFDHLVANGAYSERQASDTIRQLCDALQYLHRKGIVHGDIKPENVLLHKGRMCLVDFGVSFRMGERFFYDSHLMGTVAYAAPETLEHGALIHRRNTRDALRRARANGEDVQLDEDDEDLDAQAGPDAIKFGPKSDMFALGIVLYILLCGSHPFDTYNNLSDEEIRKRILKGKFRTQSRAWHSISSSARDLIKKLLEIDSNKRLSAEQALQHPWLRNQSQLSHEPMKNSAELLEKFQRGRRRLRASILAVLLLDAMAENLDEDDNKELESVKRSFAWGLSSSVEALNEKTNALLSTLHFFDKEGKGFISKKDLARVSESLGKHMSDNELNEMLVGATGDPEQNISSVDAVDYDNVKMMISTLRSATYRPGEAIIREGHAGAHNVYLLLDGEVEVSCKNPIKKSVAANETDEEAPITSSSTYEPSEDFAGLPSRPSWPGFIQTRPTTSGSDEMKLRRLPKGTFFGEIELVRPDGRFLPRIATYRCAEGSDTPCKVLQVVADDYLNLKGTYESINNRLEKTAHRHIRQHLIKCVEAAKGSVKMRTFDTGDFIYKEGEPCDSVFILLDGQVEVLKAMEGVVVEELHPGDYFPLGVSGQTRACKIVTRHSSVRCTQPVKVMEIGGETFRSFLSSNKFLAAYFREEVMTREQQRLDRLMTA